MEILFIKNSYHIETSQLTYFIYQLTSFYMITSFCWKLFFDCNKISNEFGSTQISQIKHVLFSKAPYFLWLKVVYSGFASCELFFQSFNFEVLLLFCMHQYYVAYEIIFIKDNQKLSQFTCKYITISGTPDITKDERYKRYLPKPKPIINKEKLCYYESIHTEIQAHNLYKLF